MADKNTTAYWVKLFQKWWDEKGSQQKRPRYPANLKEGYRDAADLEISRGKSPSPLTFNKGREAFIEKRGPGQGLKVVYQDTLDIKGSTRRAETKSKTISAQERIDWYKRNLYPNPTQRGTDNFKRDAERRAATKSRARQLTKQGTPSIYEHLSPLNAPEEIAGGFESARNTVVAPAKENGFKSDKVASTKVLREQGVPTTRSGAIRADAHDLPLPGTDESRFNAVYDDVQSNARPKASALKKQLPILQAKKAQVFRKLAPIVPGIGIAAGAVDATARSAKAAETKDPVDGVQASLAAAGTIPAVGNIADGANLILDCFRWLSQKTVRDNLEKGAAKAFTGASTGRW